LPRSRKQDEEDSDRTAEDLEPPSDTLSDTPPDTVAPDAEQPEDSLPPASVDPAGITSPVVVGCQEEPPQPREDPEATADVDCGAAQAASETEPPRSEADPELLILLDWDDTIMPTTFLQRRGIDLTTQEVPEDVVAALKAYGEHAANTLRALLLHGSIVIVTNAETGWVELTAARFLPAVEPLLRDVECISARSTFEPKGFATPVEWKEEAFAQVVGFRYGEKRGMPVLSIGDAKHEREAVHRIALRCGIVPKSVKLMVLPDVEMLQREHELLFDQVHHLCTVDGPFDICVDQGASED
jgi:hypothetical protein